MRSLAFSLGLLSCLMVGGCAIMRWHPPEKELPDQIRPPSLPPLALWIEIRGGWPRATLEEVWFARIGPLNKSDCLAKDELSKETAEGPASPGDPTCTYNKRGDVMWKPTIHRGKIIYNWVAYLEDPMPGRYVAVAAGFDIKALTLQGFPKGSLYITLFFPESLVKRTEVSVALEGSASMGNYVLAYDPLADFDRVQRRFRGEIMTITGRRGTRFFHEMASFTIYTLFGLTPSTNIVLEESAYVQAASDQLLSKP